MHCSIGHDICTECLFDLIFWVYFENIENGYFLGLSITIEGKKEKICNIKERNLHLTTIFFGIEI